MKTSPFWTDTFPRPADLPISPLPAEVDVAIVGGGYTGLNAARLQKRMAELFPDLRGVPITHTWTGQLGLTFDLMPHIGRINGIHYTLGYCGHGVSIATYVGTEAGLLLAGKKPPAPSSKSPTRPTSSTATAPGSSPSPPSTTEYWIGCLKE